MDLWRFVVRLSSPATTFFNMIGFLAGKNADGDFSETFSLSKLQQYASEIGLDEKTGIEISEASPHVSDSKAVPSYIGQGNHLFIPVSLHDMRRHWQLPEQSMTFPFWIRLQILRVKSLQNMLRLSKSDDVMFRASYGMIFMMVCAGLLKHMSSSMDLE